MKVSRLVLELLRTVYKRLTAGGSTEEQAVQSGIWVAGINVGDRILQLLKVVILARLLSPEAFGLLGIALLVIAGLRQFSNLGFDEALIQHKNDNIDEYLNTAWILKIARGSIIAIVAFLTAPYLAVFFGEPSAGPLIKIIGLSPLILGLQNPAVVYFQKNLNFHKEFIYQVGGRIVDLTVAVIIALIFNSVWALAAGIVSMNIVKLFLSYVIHRFRPKIQFNLGYGQEMFEFGKWMFASSILIFLYTNGDDLFVGWFFTATSLGFYQLAYRFSNAPASEITHTISRVSFPTLSKVKDDTRRLRNGYLQVVKTSTLIAFPMAAGIAAIAPQFVNAILGNQWGPMVPLLQLLAVYGGIRALEANVGPLFMSIDKPEYDTYLHLIKVIFIAIFVYPAADYLGIVGVAWVVIGSRIIVQPISLYLIVSIIGGGFKQLLMLIFYPLACSIIMFILVTQINEYLFNNTGILQMAILILFGIVIYFSTMIVVEKQTQYEFTSTYQILRQAI